MTFQGNDLTPSAVFDRIEDTYLRLELLKTEDGDALTTFKQEFNKETETFKGFNVENFDAGNVQFELDRRDLVDCTLAYIKRRFDPLQENIVLQCMRDSFGHRRLPPVGYPRCTEWGVHEVQCLASHFAGLKALK